MKPILDWYLQLPEPIRSQAIENYDADFASRSESMVAESFKGVERSLRVGFNWDKSPQGYKHWDMISQRAAKGEFDKKK